MIVFDDDSLLGGQAITVFDVGANIGLYSVSLGRALSKDATVVAVECNPTLLRRLRRICRFYGTEPVFIMCSATIANPGELVYVNSSTSGDGSTIFRGSINQAWSSAQICSNATCG